MAQQTREVDTRTVHVSDALQARLDTYREQCADRTTTSVVFEAIEELRADLPELMRTARARLTSQPSPHTTRTHLLGSGPVQILLRPGTSQAAVLEQLSDELGSPATTWLPPLLNAYLPGRREPENMPWLVAEGR